MCPLPEKRRFYSNKYISTCTNGSNQERSSDCHCCHSWRYGFMQRVWKQWKVCLRIWLWIKVKPQVVSTIWASVTIKTWNSLIICSFILYSGCGGAVCQSPAVLLWPQLWSPTPQLWENCICGKITWRSQTSRSWRNSDKVLTVDWRI